MTVALALNLIGGLLELAGLFRGGYVAWSSYRRLRDDVRFLDKTRAEAARRAESDPSYEVDIELSRIREQLRPRLARGTATYDHRAHLETYQAYERARDAKTGYSQTFWLLSAGIVLSILGNVIPAGQPG